MPIPPPPAPLSPAETTTSNIDTNLKVAALAYDKDSDGAPRLTAKGRGNVAEKILAVAREHNLPIRSDADLMAILDRVEVGTEIPLEVYAVVAEIFAFLYKANQGKANPQPSGATNETLAP